MKKNYSYAERNRCYAEKSHGYAERNTGDCYQLEFSWDFYTPQSLRDICMKAKNLLENMDMPFDDIDCEEGYGIDCDDCDDCDNCDDTRDDILRIDIILE